MEGDMASPGDCLAWVKAHSMHCVGVCFPPYLFFPVSSLIWVSLWLWPLISNPRPLPRVSSWEEVMLPLPVVAGTSWFVALPQEEAQKGWRLIKPWIPCYMQYWRPREGLQWSLEDREESGSTGALQLGSGTGNYTAGVSGRALVTEMWGQKRTNTASMALRRSTYGRRPLPKVL